MATLASAEQERHIIDEVVRTTTRPAGVGLPKIVFAEDHSGDESVYVTFPASRKIPLNASRLKELTALADQVREKLYGNGIERIPYVRFSESR